jgi:AcrR family transcriptional regulator
MSRPATLEPARNGSGSRGGERTRRRILAAALRLFSREGFHGTSVRALARAVDLTEAAIYYHFPSKRAIVRALYEERGFLSALDQLEHLPGDRPLAAQLTANALASARLWDENADFLRVVIVEVLRGDRAARAAHREMMDRWLRGIVDLLARYRVRGEIHASAELVEVAESWVDIMFGAFMDRLLALGRPSRRTAFLTPEFARRIEAAAAGFAHRLQSPQEVKHERG